MTRTNLPIGAGYSSEEIAKAKAAIARFYSWQRINPEAWAFIERLFLERVSLGERVSGAWLVEQVRKKSFVDRMGNDTKVNNVYAPIIIRLLLKKHPAAASLVEKRTTIFEWLV